MQLTNKQYFIIVIFFVLTVLGSFFSGFFLKGTLIKETNNNISAQKNSIQKFRPNFIDEAILITKDEPRKALVLSAIRTYAEPKNNYTIKVFYFDSQKWFKKIVEGKSDELENIPTINPIKIWNIENDPSYMLSQKINGEVDIEGNILNFDFPLITNEMPIRSHYKYTRFMSEAESRIVINNQEFETFGLYTRTYSFNPPESLIFTTNPAGIETEWLAFWDNQGNFYSIDESIVDDKITSKFYKAHSLSTKKDSTDNVIHTFSLDLTKNSSGYTANIRGGINQSFNIKKINSVNKSINGTDQWTVGLVEGNINSNPNVNGVGLFESISQ